MEVDEEEESGRGRRTGRNARRASSRESGTISSNWPEGSVPPGEAGPSTEGGRAPFARPSSAFGPDAEGRFAPGAPRGVSFPQNAQGGIDLPPLSAALTETALRDMGMSGSAYARSGLTGFPIAPSRTHSPLAGPGVSNAPPSQYHLPPPVPTHGYPHHMYPPAPGTAAAPVPTYMDLERHYSELEREKRQLQELLERTERMMAGLKRGIEDLRQSQPQAPAPLAHHQAAPPPGHHAPPAAPAVSLNRVERTPSMQSVWPVAPAEPSGRD